MDALTTLIHLESNGWISRGIGDYVNASNLSKKKLGDCDYQNASTKKAVAYEAHGGLLTQTYLDEHIRTLPKIAKPRIDEWKTFSSPSEWSVEVVFVAHEFDAKSPDELEIEQVKFRIKFISYFDLISLAGSSSHFEAINTYLLAPLSRKDTPSFARKVLLDML